MKSWVAIALILVVPLSVVVFAQQPIDPVRVQGMLDTLQAQLAQANAAIAASGGEIASLKAQLKAAEEKAKTCK